VRVKGAAFVLVLIAVLSIAVGNEASAQTCVQVPQTIPRGSLVGTDSKVNTHVAAILYVVLVEPDKYTGSTYPHGFPWLSVVSANKRILAPVQLCPQHGVSSLPVKVAAFRASRAGKTTLVARLARPWRSVKAGPRRYRSTVTVLH
jgi:hypothetical protein